MKDIQKIKEEIEKRLLEILVENKVNPISEEDYLEVMETINEAIDIAYQADQKNPVRQGNKGRLIEYLCNYKNGKISQEELLKLIWFK